jgi:hypothetical protein
MELARWITPPLPWAPLDEDGNDVPVYLGVSTVYCQRISVVDNFLHTTQDSDSDEFEDE